ncbi:AAL176Cp [Eremothecium gossypii ATCC 10895]|uniref:AAL176Cp n=1 Tax=Eremothecium gossypii (strain ATCC 10895 / CBS 109.51 / FGSC 9923 / NRRL Y-1056) TaxID=284811 RepID=Q75F92_EREGS|nr:AAL176Cp [Eremothecium gossypii ATCC 10895]AAS50190.1 AAL176Cp [Eremothecium gossypii ATCC 10895]AEY94475.1 FAAL176Cp [Eremothecium gossypii FDAG1]
MLQFKLVLLGDSSVGKSSIVHRFVKDSFDEFRESTIGAAFLSRTIKLADHDDAMIKFEIWDTAGQERYKSLAPMYYRNANAALVVYDVTQEDSLAKAQSWVNELKSKVGDEDLVIFLVGNKLDLVDEDCKPRVIDSEEAQAYAEAHGLMFHEVSAKTGTGILDVFQGIGGKLYEQRRESLAAQPQHSSSIQLQRPTTNDATSCCV